MLLSNTILYSTLQPTPRQNVQIFYFMYSDLYRSILILFLFNRYVRLLLF